MSVTNREKWMLRQVYPPYGCAVLVCYVESPFSVRNVTCTNEASFPEKQGKKALAF